MKDWFDSTIGIENATVEVGFVLFPDFYYGPDRHQALVERKEVERLKLPTFPRASERLVTTSEAEEHVEQLIQYYSDVIRLSRKYSKSFNQIRQYFWLRLSIANGSGSFCVSFPWYDTLSEMESVLRCLASPPAEGEIFWDRDQGWELELDAFNGMLYVREWDPDCEEVYVSARLPLLSLSSSSKEALERAQKIIAKLSEALTEDAWTSHKVHPTFSKLVLAEPTCPSAGE